MIVAMAGRRKGWRCPNVWARTDSFDDNPVKQLLIPAGVFTVVSGAVGALEVRNNYGTWPAGSANQPRDSDSLWAKLPIGAKPGDALTRATWNTPSPLVHLEPRVVLDSYNDAITFNEGTVDTPGLRSPQLGAMHAVLGTGRLNA
ncbi:MULTISPECIES: hypothetical protein [unclassified Amycolatopsis]|uniref:hypothetical protein n=1 Tax=unclassified Amycolatopsis TaxID=2618356 RepID=UPI0028750FF9|nr:MULTISPECIES: hypothetical protein [unclassified Amycolatopsis]MDS0135842.1 hypothetical protein [Amycolatopsis sp. 505]MDS0149672.1 hypothetical protein [Amycolatopsis sp. CM201R]